jgi:acetyl esterase/lipase
MRFVIVARALIVVLLAAPSLTAQVRVDRNVVYGMYSGLALLMDVHHPAESNGYGLILIWGSGWHSPPEYGAGQLKGRGVPAMLLDVGYTVFTINHRAAPRFRYPAAVEDAQRAVRFVRYNAERYRIDPDQLGGVGYSSGAHLISILATMDGHGGPDDDDPVNRESAKLQAVVARAAPTDFGRFDSGAVPTFASFLGAPPGRDNATYRAASPITYVTADDPPLLLIAGDADQTVPFEQSELMLAALEEKGVGTNLIRIPGGGHGANDPPAAARWLNHHLLSEAGAADRENVIAAHEHLLEGIRLARAGNIPEAMEEYRTAQDRDARLTITGADWNQLCWNGSLWEHAAEVMAACERAVALAPDNGGIRDSRGLARALTGDIAGAIEDFEAFVSSGNSDGLRAQRLDWIDALRAGEDPFTPELLSSLRGG